MTAPSHSLRSVGWLSCGRVCLWSFVAGLRLTLTLGRMLSAAARLRFAYASSIRPRHGRHSHREPARLHCAHRGSAATPRLLWLGASPLRFTLRRLASSRRPECPHGARIACPLRSSPARAGVSSSPALAGGWHARCPPLGARFYYFCWCFPAPRGRMAQCFRAATTSGGTAAVSVSTSAPYRSRPSPCATMRHAA